MPWTIILEVGMIIIKWLWGNGEEAKKRKKTFLDYIQSKKPDINIPAEKRREFEELKSDRK